MPQPDAMMCLDLPDATDLGADMEAYFAKCQEKLGMIPNVLRVYAKHPEKLRNFVATYNTLMLAPSGLSKLEREMVAVVVSSANRCYYCLVAHGQAVRALSGDPQLGEMLALNHRIADLPPRERAILDYAWKLTTDPMAISNDDRNGLRAVGLSDMDIFDLSDVVGFFNYTNRVAHATEMMPNPEYHAMTR
jgi:uncharacterized peroxidase-related enzyme